MRSETSQHVPAGLDPIPSDGPSTAVSTGNEQANVCTERFMIRNIMLLKSFLVE